MAKIISLFIFSMCIASFYAYPTQIEEFEDGLTLTPSQREQLQKFREVVADILEDDYERSDEYLLGYLQSKQWKIFSAKQMLKIAMSWKRTHNIEELSKSNFSSEMLKRFPVRLDGFDKNGCPLMEIHFGDWDIAGYILNQEFVRDGKANVLKHFLQLMAKMELRNRNSFPKCHRTRAIVSLQNYNPSITSEVNSINAIVQMINIYVNYFPNTVFLGHLIDVPDSFAPMLELLKTTVSSEVYAVAKVHKGGMEKWKKYLDDVIEVDQRSRKSGGIA